MGTMSRLVQGLVFILKWISICSITLLMLFIIIGVIGRLVGHPITSSIESAEILHFFAIVSAFSYTQLAKGHISVGLFVDRFSQRAQAAWDIVANVIGVIVCFTFAFVFYKQGMREALELHRTSMILGFPYWISNFAGAIGFLGWGLVALLQIFRPQAAVKKEEVTGHG